MIKFIGKTDIDFLQKRHLAMTISGISILIGLIVLVLRGGPNYSIDFEGGLSVLLRFSHAENSVPITEEMVRGALTKIDLGSSEVKMSRSTEGEDLLIRVKEEARFTSPVALMRAKLDQLLGDRWRMVLDEQLAMEGFPDLGDMSYIAVATDAKRSELQAVLDSVAVDNPRLIKHETVDGEEVWILSGSGNDTISRLRRVISEDFPEYSFEIRSIDRVGPRMGSELRMQAILAILAALGLIIIYLWWRFELLFGLAAVVALFHDVLITLGVFSILNLEISLTVIGAFLTLVGYSLNDTIVVFDRIRENLKRYRDKDYGEVINISINQNLSRTIITSGTTFLVVMVLFFMGGQVLHSFALALLVGIVVGTYSSIYIASPILVEWAEKIGQEAGQKKGKISRTTRARRTKRVKVK